MNPSAHLLYRVVRTCESSDDLSVSRYRHYADIHVNGFNCKWFLIKKKRRTDARPLLGSVHWLPIKQRITHKMATSTFKVMSTSTPAYLSDLIQPAAPARPLLSVAPLLTVPRVRTELARRAFLVVAPQTWNSLPADIRSCHTLQTFKCNLKTHLFTQS